MPIHNWMSGLKGNRKLVELCLPGSHDAGVYRDPAAGVKPGSSARTQYSNIWQQAKDGYLGEYGGTLLSAMDDAATFLKVFPTEFLIFRIGHTKCTGNVAKALQQFRKKTDPVTHKMPYASIINRGATGNLADLEVSQ